MVSRKSKRPYGNRDGSIELTFRLYLKPNLSPCLASHGAMSYVPHVDVLQILRATLSLLENTDFLSKESDSVVNLKRCLRDAIAEIHLTTPAASAHDPEV